jgi:large subunit ribosomal protein L21
MSLVIASGSKQYIVQKGQQVIVDRIHSEEGSEIDIQVVAGFDAGLLSKAGTVKAKIVKHLKGEKVRVVKYKSKSNYHKQSGFRAYQTMLEILG